MAKKDEDIRTALELALGILPEEDLDTLTRFVVTNSYAAGSVVCREGDLEDIFYIIQDGKVAFTKKTTDGEQFLGLKGRGEFFGELGVLDRAPRAATVHAISDCCLIEIREEVLDQIITRNPSVARAIMRGLTRSVRDTDKITIAELQLKNSELAKTLENLRAAQAELLRRERMKRDLEIAAQVHNSILPTSFPDVEGFEFASVARPAREIGGDFYDVVDMGRQVGIVMADASGKSVQAAIYMAVVRALFLSEAKAGLSPREAAHQIHNLLMTMSSTTEMFITVFYATIDTNTRHMKYVRAGHDRPIHYQGATGKITLLDPPGRFLGLLPDLIVEEEELVIEPGDVLVCYSDGVTDAVRPGDGEMYGLERLSKIVFHEGHRSAQEIVDLIVEDVDRFRDGEEQPDDLTLLVTKAL